MKKRSGKKIVKYFFLGLVLVFIIIQFIRIDKTNPKVDKNKDLISIYKPNKEIENILRTSCYDCHSFETVYPWYSNVAPVSWMLKDHIDEGREELNFSKWGAYSEKKANHKLRECTEEVEEKHMPLDSYLITHDDADLSSEQRKKLVEWFESLMTGGDGGHDE